MPLYAFDGTGNEDNPRDGENTNVNKFSKAHIDEADGNFYVSGVGTRFSLLGTIFGGIMGAGGHDRINEARDQLEANFKAGHREIDIIGFSRGAALALEFANDIHDDGVNGEAAPAIRFLGLWDTVASFGLPGNNINLGYELTVPSNVETCRHAMSLDERRFMFPLTRATQDKFSDRDLIDIQEVWFRGYHSDIGGGNDNEGLSDITLYWMYRQAEAAGLAFDLAGVDAAKAGRNPATDPKTPGMDRRANKKRTIRISDQVHDSVARIEQAGRFEANNPPKGLSVVDDDGNVLSDGFEELSRDSPRCSVVPDLLRNGKSLEISHGERLIRRDSHELLKRHANLPDVLGTMPGRSLQDFVQGFFAEIGIRGLPAGFVLETSPPFGHPGANAVAVFADLRHRLNFVGRVVGIIAVGQQFAAGDIEKGLRDSKDMVGQFTVGSVPVHKLLIETIVRDLANMPRRRGEDHLQLSDELLRRQLWTGVHLDPEKLGDIADRLGKDELVTPRDDGNRTRAKTSQQRYAVRVAVHVDRFMFDILGRKKLFRSKTAGSPRLPKHTNDVAHDGRPPSS